MLILIDANTAAANQFHRGDVIKCWLDTAEFATAPEPEEGPSRLFGTLHHRMHIPERGTHVTSILRLPHAAARRRQSCDRVNDYRFSALRVRRCGPDAWLCAGFA